jgi:hypothetical protein
MELIDITPEDSVVPVYLEVLTEEEQAIRDADILESQKQQEQREAELEAKALARQSALSKLAALGLTQEEIDSL